MKLELVSDYFSLLFKPQFIFGFALYAASFLTWILILSKKDISYAYPIVMGLGYVTVMVTAAIFFKDSFSFNKILGAIFVGLGVVIISF